MSETKDKKMSQGLGRKNSVGIFPKGVSIFPNGGSILQNGSPLPPTFAHHTPLLFGAEFPSKCTPANPLRNKQLTRIAAKSYVSF